MDGCVVALERRVTDSVFVHAVWDVTMFFSCSGHAQSASRLRLQGGRHGKKRAKEGDTLDEHLA
ncbi:unnamed protein product [Ectocarpus sp. 6 AP-2014]